MDISLTFIRGTFFLICILISIAFAALAAPEGASPVGLGIAAVAGGAFSALLILSENLLKRFNLRSFNTALIGIFLGFLLGQAIVTVLKGVFSLTLPSANPAIETLIHTAVYLAAIYVGMVMTARGAEEIYVSLPFIKFKPSSLKKKDLLIDSSVLQDPRIIDLAASGLLDHHLVIPRFVLTELYTLVERGDEAQRGKARRALDVLKKLEALHTLGLRYTETNFPEIKDPHEKLIKLARFLNANLITADMNQIELASIEDIRVILFQKLCNSLKPLSQSGEQINIKIQRYGKEERQGVGYLEDGTMVVVNGGAEYIGETIRAHVLSVKHTSSGRMIFCNAIEEDYEEENYNRAPSGNVEHEETKSYFTSYR